jgi:ferrous iron transport protein B
MSEYKIGLVGNPNSGKTTIFNSLTGLHQHVGNYPGVTVESKAGNIKIENNKIQLVDLPGTYSLSPNSPEEVVVRDEILSNKFDLIVNIVDATNFERNLYLTIQLFELGVPVLLVLNMIDVAESKCIKFNLDKLSELMQVPVVKTVGSKGRGIPYLKEAIIKACQNKSKQDFCLVKNADPHVQECIKNIKQLLEDEKTITIDKKSDWVVIKLLEKDSLIIKEIENFGQSGRDLVDKIYQQIARLEEKEGDKSSMIIARTRYGFINFISQKTVSSGINMRNKITERIDSVVTNRFLAIPIFLMMMYLVFQLTFTLGGPFMDYIDASFGWLGDFISSLWPAGSESLLKSLLVDGIIAGVGGVIIFLPNILLLFFAIALLEATGYMARIAFVMDKLMNKLGLHGRSFIPLIIGFGCSIPAIMATRTLESKRDRLTTMMIIPLMSCGAKLPIYALIIPAFFPELWQARIMFIIYMIGVGLAILSALVMRKIFFKGDNVPFVMELPPYRLPTFKSICIHMWERAMLYLKKAGTLILAASVILWVASTFPQKTIFDKNYDSLIQEIELSDLQDEQKQVEIADVQNEKMSEIMQYTIAGRIGRGLEPIFRPLGFDWRINTALVGAFAAKEVFVSQLGIVNAVGDVDAESVSLRTILGERYNALQGFCIMLYCLISVPCLATFAITKRETNSWKWPFLQLAWLTLLAYIVTLIVYQSGVALGIGV